jgi:flagellar biosynthesis chaperone FliJ
VPDGVQFLLIRSDRGIVRPRTPLDAAVRVREVDEDRARVTLADAQRLALQTAAAVREAAQRSLADDRHSGTAADWTVIELAHIRALQETRRAEQERRAAEEKLGASRERFVGARTRAEALRRALEARRSEMQVVERLTEHKTMDEVASLLRGRR